MSIIIKLQGLPLEASSIDVRRYFTGLKIPDGGVHIVGGADGNVFIEFDSDEDARQAMSRSDGVIKNSYIKLMLSSRTEMQTVVDTARQQKQQYLQQQLQKQQQQLNQQPPTHQEPLLPQHSNFQQSLPTSQQSFLQPQGGPMGPPLLPQQQQQQLNQQPQTQQQPQLPLQSNFQQSLLTPQQNFLQPLGGPMVPPLFPLQQQSTPFDGDPRMLSQNYQGILNVITMQQQPQPQLQPQQQPQPLLLPPTTTTVSNPTQGLTQLSTGLLVANQNQSPDSRARMSGMRGGDDKLFANKRCVLAASNIPYRATSKDIIEFLAEFNINEDCIRRRYNQKGQPTADAKIAFQTPDAAMRAFKMMNKKSLCGRQVFLKPV